MSICKYCGYIGGFHKSWCAIPHAPAKYTTRIEWTGNIQVHHPVNPKPKAAS